MISSTMNDAINKQINAEFYSAYLYLSMAIYFESVDLSGFANWMRVQAEEEQFHAMKFYDYLHERDGKVELEAIEKPTVKFDGLLEAFEQSLEHEQKITAMINDLMALAMDEKDFATANFLQWFIEEQVEEEASVKSIIAQLKMIDGKGHALLMFDREFATRKFVAPE